MFELFRGVAERRTGARLAVRAQVQGVVILEAVVDGQGRVEDERVLRSIPLLDGAAIAAVRQWRYSPLRLNGQPERFVLTVTLSFSVGSKTASAGGG
jgi:protein TonB